MQKLSEKTHPENIYVQPESKPTLQQLTTLNFRWTSLFCTSEHDWLRFRLSTFRDQEKIQVEKDEFHNRFA